MKKFLQKANKTNYLKIAIVVLISLNLLIALYIAFFKKDALWLEQIKSGGKQNFKLVEKLYNNQNFKDQQAQTLNQIIDSMGNENIETDSALEPLNNSNILDEETISSITKDTFVKGDQNAKFLIFEYSDFLCPFCQRHHNDKTLQKVQEKYPSDVALVFKNMPLVQLHPTAPMGAEAAECAGKLGGSNAFYEFVDSSFTQSTFNEDVVSNIAKEIGLDSKELLSCVNNGEFKTKVDSIIQEARSIFGINGTPGNVILDKETGKYVIVNGAYPFEKFDEEIQNLMNQ